MGKIVVAPTDFDWFTFLSKEERINKINFWTPTPWNIKQLNEGDKFYFLLKSPIRKVGGYGYYKSYGNLVAEQAWIKYGRGNGVNNLNELVVRANDYARKNSKSFMDDKNPTIGCIMLTDPVFFDETEYFVPEERGLSFPKQVVKFKYFEASEYQLEFIDTNNSKSFDLVNPDHEDRGTVEKKNRKGQSKFRNAVLQAYGGRCAITGEGCVDVIEAAHIQEYINEQSNHIQNGLPLRADLHALFDAGLITITKNYCVKVSSQLDSDEYRLLDNKKIRLPTNLFNYPSDKSIELHNNIVFRK